MSQKALANFSIGQFFKSASMFTPTSSIVTISAISSGSITFTPALSNYTTIRSASLSWLDSSSLSPFYSITGGGSFQSIDSTAFSVLFSFGSTTTIVTQSNSSFIFNSSSIVGASTRQFSISYLTQSIQSYYDDTVEEAYVQLTIDTTNNENSIKFDTGLLNSTTGEVEFTSNTPVKGGIGTSARGIGSFAMGSGSIAQESASVAEGINTLASGLASHAAGINTTASGQAAFSMGIETDADGMASFAAGSGSWARGTATVAMGIGTVASSSGQLVVGHYNETKTDKNNIFVVGDGTGPLSANRRNIIEVYGGQGALFRGVKIDTAATPTITTAIDGFNVYGKTRFFGSVTGSSMLAIDFNAIGNDVTIQLSGSTITTGSFTSNFYRRQAVFGGGPEDFEDVLKASAGFDHRGINFSLSEQTTAPGSTFLWTNSSNRLFYSSSAVILNGGNTLGSTMLIGTNDTNNLELETGGTTRVFISSSGNVGIGTTTPTNTLQVNGGVTATSLTASGATINGNVTITGTASIAFLNVTYESASVIYSTGSNQFGDASDDTQTLYGSVVIPTGSLTVTGSTNITGSLNVTSGITGSLFGTSSWAINALTASNIFPAITNNTDNKILTATGGGIINGESNLTFDGSVLTVSGSILTTGAITSSGVISSSAGLFSTTLLTGNITASNISASSGVTGSLFGTSSWAVSASQALTASFIAPTGNAFVQGGNSFGTTALLGTNDSQSLQFETSGSVRVTISSSGNVGIGTTTPTARLQIAGTSNDGISLDANHTSFQGINARLPGRVIVGASAGAYPKIMYNAVPSSSVSWSYAANDTAWAINMGGGNRMGFEYVAAGTAGTSFSSWNTIMALVSGSNSVGIGTTSPAALLDVNGNTIIRGALTASIISASSNISSSTLHTAGNTAVGGTLSVTGATTLVGALTASNISASNNISGSTLHITGNENIGGTSTITGRLTVNSGITTTSITASGVISSSAGLLGTTVTATSNVTVGGTLNVTGATTLTGALTASNISASSWISGSDLRVAAATTIGGTLGVTGATTLTGALTASNISASNNISGSTLHITGSGNILGNVGIGTTTPTNTLQVIGGITSTSITASNLSASGNISASTFRGTTFTGTAPVGFIGTSSWAVSASFALTASYFTGQNFATFTQSIASTTWTFNHNLNFRTPVITVYDSNYEVVIPDSIQGTSANQSVITFSTARAGYASATMGSILPQNPFALALAYAIVL